MRTCFEHARLFDTGGMHRRASFLGLLSHPNLSVRLRPKAVLRLNLRVVRSRLLDPPGGVVSRIFLSYARDDVDAAKHLAEGISRAGHDVWWDRNLHGGSRFDTEIDQALESAEA